MVLHQPDDDFTAILAALKVGRRRVPCRSNQQSGQHGGLGGQQFVGGSSEVALGGCLETARTCAEIGTIQVDGQDVFFRVAQFHRHRVDGFLHLPHDRGAAAIGLEFRFCHAGRRIVLGPEAQELGGLLRQGRTAVAGKRAATFAKVDAHRTGYAARRQAEVAVEALVFRRDDRVLEIGRDGVRSDLAAELLAAPGKDGAVPIEQGDRSPSASVQKIVHGGQGRGIVEHDARYGERDQSGYAPADSPYEPRESRYQPDQRIA